MEKGILALKDIAGQSAEKQQCNICLKAYTKNK